MIEELRRICDEAGPLTGADHALFEGDRRFITTVVLRFESLTAVIRAVSEDDTLTVALGPFRPEPQETTVAASAALVWAKCLHRPVFWAWQLTNQQGYADGVRLEFGTPEQPVTVELIVVASSIKLFHATELS